jgi:hypothetical protein
VPEYFWFNPLEPDFAGFTLVGGTYEPIEPDSAGRLVSAQLSMALRAWDGQFHGTSGHWLRWETLDGFLPPTADELALRADAEGRRAESEHQRAEREHQRAERLAAQLRAAGLDPQP